MPKRLFASLAACLPAAAVSAALLLPACGPAPAPKPPAPLPPALLAPAASATAARAPSSEPTWTYPELTGGTNNWLKDFPLCIVPQQSPIVTTPSGTTPGTAKVTPPPRDAVVPIERDTWPNERAHNNFQFKVPTGAPPPTVTIEDPAAKTTTTWTVKSYHFHLNAEHNDDPSTPYPMELHMVSTSGRARGVFGVRLQKSPYGDQALLEGILQSTYRQPVTKPFPIGAALAKFATGAFYAYQGSLTTPACDDGIQWYVLKAPFDVAETQVASWATVFPATFGIPGNQRGSKPKETTVTLYNATGS